jgi:hypothetical protein
MLTRIFLVLTCLFSSVAAAQELINPRSYFGVAAAPSSRVTPIKTPWGKELTVNNVHSEHPRPIMVREHWLNLNGQWEWKDGTRPATEPFKEKILVPFPVESALSGVGRPMDSLVYRRTFTIPENWPKENRILLHFGAIDW